MRRLEFGFGFRLFRSRRRWLRFRHWWFRFRRGLWFRHGFWLGELKIDRRNFFGALWLVVGLVGITFEITEALDISEGGVVGITSGGEVAIDGGVR